MSPKIKQAIFATGSLLNMMDAGMMLAHPGIFIPKILAEKGDGIKGDTYIVSWLASLPGISGALAVLAVGPLMHLYGRRTTKLIATTLVLAGWILMALATSLPVLFIGRTLQGISNGLFYFNSVCIAELSCPTIRGFLLNLKIVNVSLGIIIIHGFSYFLHWKSLAWIGTLPVALSILITLCWPETPDWLISKGRYEEAETVFFSLRGRSKESDNEIGKLIAAEVLRRETKSTSSHLKKWRSKELWRPVVLLICGILVPEAGGRKFFPSYSLQLSEQITGDKNGGFFYTMIIDLICLVATFFSSYLINRFSRRSLIVNCGLAANLCLQVACLLMFIRKNYYDSEILMWTGVTFFTIYYLIIDGSTFGACFVIMGELFSLEFRALGIVIDGIIACVLFIIAMKLTPILKESLDIHGMFFTYSLCMVAALIYMWYDLPETKDRTLHDISEYFRGKSPKIRTEVGNDEEFNVLNENKSLN